MDKYTVLLVDDEEEVIQVIMKMCIRDSARIQDGRTLIKRVIGLPGEEIYIEKESGGVYIDGDKLEEPYIQGQTCLLYTSRCV